MGRSKSAAERVNEVVQLFPPVCRHCEHSAATAVHL
jgi:hypothetical protein